MTLAPAAASANAVARPIPREAPVTKAVLLRRAVMFFYLRFRRRVPSRHVPSSSRVQKQSRMFNEELRVHVVRAVIGVGVDDQLRIRHVLLHDERVHRGHDHVVTAVHAECWLLGRLQRGVAPFWWATHLPMASAWAADPVSFTSGSRPSCLRCVRFRNSRPAAWPAADGLNLTASQTFSGGSWGWAPKDRPVAWAINSIP